MKPFPVPSNVSVKPPELIAHRGYALRYPENTLPSLRAAIRAQARYLHFDVQMTGDGVPVVLRDADLWRTAGVAGNVLDMSLAEVMQVEVNETDRLGSRFTSVHIPLLGEAVALLEEHPNVVAFVELKGASVNRFGVEPVVARVLEVLQPVLDRCVVISFDWLAIERAREAGAPAVGWVLEEWCEEARAIAERLKPEYLLCDYRMVADDPGLWPGPWRWALYEVIDPELALALAVAGAEFVETTAIKEMLADRRMLTSRRRR
jgi:glycerophosphoryl diester phosphodiesterase